jgi:hypothetical protein
MTIAATQPESATTDDDVGHADGDHGHDRPLHQDVVDVDAGEEAARQQRGDDAEHDQRHQRHLAEQPVEAGRRQRGACRFRLHPPSSFRSAPSV